jgi:uncharacterized Ntn-hydrolase superfamily protein
MKQTFYPLLFAFVLFANALYAQDTFSIVAVDEETGEVGSAGASCISADNLESFFPGADPDFLGDLIPGLGAINTQSFYLPQNQVAARNRLLAGDTPQQVLNWLAANDAQGNSTQRQYGIAAIINGEAQAGAFTGVNCMNQKGHRTGPNYAIQGNILLSTEILDDMEAAFLNTEGCLAEKIMAAMQAAKVPGADSRCLSNGTSAMFAFLKVARQDDMPNDPAVRIFVAYNPEGIEPIDSLQGLFDLLEPCLPSSGLVSNPQLEFEVFPNPTEDAFRVQFPARVGVVQMRVFDAQGRLVLQADGVQSGELIKLAGGPGVYILNMQDEQGRTASRTVVKE